MNKSKALGYTISKILGTSLNAHVYICACRVWVNV